MIYNSADLMHTPWEIIIKVFRKKLNDKFFDTLAEYQQEFLNFLHEKEFFATGDDEVYFLREYVQRKIYELNYIVINKYNIELDNVVSEETRTNFYEKLNEFLIDEIQNLSQKSDFCEELAGLTLEDFQTKSESFFADMIQENYVNHGYNITDANIENLVNYLFLLFKTKFTRYYTGLVFSGFGEEEIYPQMIAVNISFSFNGKLRYFIDENNCASVSTHNTGFIKPFAQTDVIDTILGGIDPLLEDEYNKNFALAFQKYNNLIIEKFGEETPQVREIIESLNAEALAQDFIQNNIRTKVKKYIDPLMNAVNSLSKEDLAEMAESLIYLTYLKRKITFAEESVGGPVDVAIISKGDGFVWIKRKHYFKSEINPLFTNNYFRI